MKIYVAFDCSMSFSLHSSKNSSNQEKFNRALRFLCAFVNEMASSQIDVNLVKFSKNPKILKYSAKTDIDVIGSFPISILSPGTPDFLQLRSLILNENIFNDFELIFLLAACNYQWIPSSFHLPCPIRFLLFTDAPNSVSLKLISELRSISAEFNPDEDPEVICRDEDVDLMLEKLNKVERLQRKAIIALSDKINFKIALLPGMSRIPTFSYDVQVLKCVDEFTSSSIPTLKVIGFTKSQNLFNIPSSTLTCVVKPEETCEGDELAGFHLLAETIGAENMVAILRHQDTQEEYALKPFRDNPSHLWLLYIQLIPSSQFKWVAAVPQAASIKTQLPDVSYKPNAAPQIHWTDQHNIQSDIQKLHRLLKRTDRIEQFNQELQRISNYAIAFGYHSFAPLFADVLEARCSGSTIPAENKKHLARAIEQLRNSGFKLIGAKFNL